MVASPTGVGSSTAAAAPEVDAAAAEVDAATADDAPAILSGLVMFYLISVKPRYNAPAHNENRGVTNSFSGP